MTLALGSALAIFLYPHAMTGVLAAKNRSAVRVNLALLPIYTFVLGIIALFGYVAIFAKTTPVGDPANGIAPDRNTILPRLFDQSFPSWVAGTAYAAIVIGAFVPAAIMSIAAANLFTRNVYKEFIRPDATPADQMKVSRITSLLVKFGAVAAIVFLSPQFSFDLQTIGGVIVLQTLPAVAIGLFTAWIHKRALIAGLVVGLIAGVVMLYQIPQVGLDGKVVRAHFGSSAWPLSHLGIHGGYTVYAGLAALAVNLAVAVVATPVLRRLGVPDGTDLTWRRDYIADEGDASLRRLDEILDGRPVQVTAIETPARHAVPQPAIAARRQAIPTFDSYRRPRAEISGSEISGSEVSAAEVSQTQPPAVGRAMLPMREATGPPSHANGSGPSHGYGHLPGSGSGQAGPASGAGNGWPPVGPAAPPNGRTDPRAQPRPGHAEHPDDERPPGHGWDRR